jgi:hypothetical protein
MGESATISAIKITAEIAHRESKAARGKLDSHVLISAIVIGGTGWIFLGKDHVASPSAVWAEQAFCPLVALGHLPGTPHSWDQNRCTRLPTEPTLPNAYGDRNARNFAEYLRFKHGIRQMVCPSLLTIQIRPTEAAYLSTDEASLLEGSPRSHPLISTDFIASSSDTTE